MSSEFTEHPVSNSVPALKPGVYPVKAVDVKPVATKQAEPDYPPELGSILTGQATVAFTVGIDGKVSDASVIAADDVLFGEAAVHAVDKWRFHPAEIKSAPVPCRVVLPFFFTNPYGMYYIGGAPPDQPGDTPPGGSTSGTITARPSK